MVSLMSLWMPIVLSAVAVFVLSSLVHMVLKYHAGDYARLPNEDEVVAGLSGANIPPGEYLFPYAGSMAAMNDPAYLDRLRRGASGFLNVFPRLTSERPSMAPQLAQWFVFTLIVSLFAGYLTSRAVGPGESFGEVMRFAGTVAFAAYALGAIPDSVWYRRKWSTTIKNIFDGLLYALATGAVFAWMWP